MDRRKFIGNLMKSGIVGVGVTFAGGLSALLLNNCERDTQTKQPNSTYDIYANSNSGYVKVGFEMSSNMIRFPRCRLNGDSIDFYLDSGDADFLSINSATARKYNIKATSTREVELNGKKYSVKMGCADFEIGGVLFEDIPVGIKESQFGRNHVGTGFMRNYTTHINLRNNQVDFYGLNQSFFVPGFGNEEIEMPFEFDAVPVVSGVEVLASIDGKNKQVIKGNFMFDTGCVYPLILHSEKVDTTLLRKLGFEGLQGFKKQFSRMKSEGSFSNAVIDFGKGPVRVGSVRAGTMDLTPLTWVPNDSSPRKNLVGILGLGFVTEGGYSSITIAPDLNAPHNPTKGVYRPGTIRMQK